MADDIRASRTKHELIDRWDNDKPINNPPFDVLFNVTNIQHRPETRVLYAIQIKLVEQNGKFKIFFRSNEFDVETMDENKQDKDTQKINMIKKILKGKKIISDGFTPEFVL